jgi:hypothetical protein
LKNSHHKPKESKYIFFFWVNQNLLELNNFTATALQQMNPERVNKRPNPYQLPGIESQTTFYTENTETKWGIDEVSSY